MFSTLLISNSQGQWYLQVIPGPCICSLWRLETNGNSFLRPVRKWDICLRDVEVFKKERQESPRSLKEKREREGGGGIRVNGLDRQVRIKFLVIAKDHF